MPGPLATFSFGKRHLEALKPQTHLEASRASTLRICLLQPDSMLSRFVTRHDDSYIRTMLYRMSISDSWRTLQVASSCQARTMAGIRVKAEIFRALLGSVSQLYPRIT